MLGGMVGVMLGVMIGVMEGIRAGGVKIGVTVGSLLVTGVKGGLELVILVELDPLDCKFKDSLAIYTVLI